MTIIANQIYEYSEKAFSHDTFEWAGLIVAIAGLVVAIIGLAATIIGLWFAYGELKRSREAVELSNKQCLFDRRLVNYFINKTTLEELTRNWGILESIVEAKTIKKTRLFINIAAQLFLSVPSFGSGHKSNNAFIMANEQYNRKISELRLIPDESRIIFSHIKADTGSFIEKYICMLKCLYVAHQLCAGNVTEEKYIKEKIDDLATAINLLREYLTIEPATLDLMKNELKLED